MTNEELKLITASNIINLRQSKKLTQAELGSVLNYSDKTISKWERGEAIPDAYVLTQIADFFGVDVNYLLSPNDGWELPETEEEKIETVFDSGALIAVTILGVLTAALTTFVICWLSGLFEWRIILIGVVAMAVDYLILDCIFNKGNHLKISLTILICSIFFLIYFVFNERRPWQIFIVLVPAIGVAIAATEINKRKSRIRGDK